MQEGALGFGEFELDLVQCQLRRNGSRVKLERIPLDLLILLGVGRDLLVDRRVHRVYLYAAPFLIVGQSLSVYMWRSNPAWWQGITRAILW